MQLSKISYKSYWLRVVLLAEAVATMPWLFTLTDLTTSPAGSFGTSMVNDWLAAEPRIEARPLAEFSEMTILLVPDCLTVPVTLPAMPTQAAIAVCLPIRQL